ncbi:MAG: LysM domain-containing protein [Anaerolineales bacterium]
MFKSFKKPQRWMSMLVIGGMLLATLGLTSAVSAKATCSSPYIVQYGDTLKGIAQKCGVTMQALLDANPAITNPNLIYRGQRIVIPTVTSNNPVKYTVQPGDTLESIAKHFDVSIGLILVTNPQITNPTRLSPGVVITIPATPVIPVTGSSAALQLSLYNGLAGTPLTITGTSFPAKESVYVSASSPGSSTSVSTNANTDKNGKFTARLRIPTNAQAGSLWRIEATPETVNSPLATATFRVITLPNNGAYIVQAGDTLSKIAQRYHTTVSALIRANPQIANPNLLEPGDLIYLPGSVLVDPNTGLTIYIVQSGDYLGAIAQRFGVTLQALLAANPQIRIPSRIYSGDRLTIPSGAIVPISGSGLYTVRSGDTLRSIAQRFGLPVRLLELANPQLTNTSRLTPGEQINIPARISFAAGGTSAVVSGSLNGGDEAYYVLRAGARQVLEVTSSPDPRLQLAIYAADGSAVKSLAGSSPNFRGYLPATGDYLLVVHALQSTSYTLNVDIPARISFATGATSATVSGNLSAHASQYYILRALKGQQLKVSVSPQDENVRMVIYGFDGNVLRSGMSSAPPSFNGTLPSTQDYIVVLSAGDQAFSYTMKVTIPAP